MVQVLPDRWGLGPALPYIGQALAQGITGRAQGQYEQQKREMQQKALVKLSQTPITGPESINKMFGEMIAAGFTVEQTNAHIKNQIDAIKKLQPDPVAVLLGQRGSAIQGQPGSMPPRAGAVAGQMTALGGPSAPPPTLDDAEQQDEIPAGIKLPSPGPLDQFSDSELVVFAGSQSANMAKLATTELQRRQTAREYGEKTNSGLIKRMDDLRSSINKQENAINTLVNAFENDDPGAWNTDRWASMFGSIGANFLTPEGALKATAIKDFLIANVAKTGSARLNKWIEQQIAAALPNLGKSREANLAISKAIQAAVQTERYSLDTYDKYRSFYEDRGLPLPPGLDRLVQAQTDKFDLENQKRLSIDLQDIKDSTLSPKDLEALANKRVSKPGEPPVPLTPRREAIIRAKWGENTPKVAKLLGYEVSTIDAFTQETQKKNDAIDQFTTDNAIDIQSPATVDMQVDERTVIEEREPPELAAIKPTKKASLSDEQIAKEIEQANTTDDSFLGQLLGAGKSVFKGVAQSAKSSMGGVSREDLLGIQPGNLTGFEETPEGLVPQFYNPESFSQQLNRAVPTEDTLLNRGAERLGRVGSGAGSLPGAGLLPTLGRSVGATVAGQAVEEAGGGPVAQALAEMGAFIAPDLTKALAPRSSEKAFVDNMNKLGVDAETQSLVLAGKRISEGKIAPKVGAKLSKATGAIEESIDAAQGGLLDAFGTLADYAKSTPPGSAQTQRKFLLGLQERIASLPSDKVRQVIGDDLAILYQSDVTPASVIRFYRAVNHNATGKNKSLIALKGPVQEYLSTIDPELGSMFRDLNMAYSKFAEFRKVMKPKPTSVYLNTGADLTSGGAVLYGMYSGNLAAIAAAIGIPAARKIGQLMLTSPRYHNFAGKMMQAVKTNNRQLAMKTIDLLKNQLAEDGEAEALQALSTLSDKEVMDFLKLDE